MLLRGACITALVSMLVLPSSVGAHADTPGCVSKREYNRIPNGMATAQVHRIFDTAGAVTGLGAPNEVRHYRPCARSGLVQVTYSPRGLVVDKSGQWLD